MLYYRRMPSIALQGRKKPLSEATIKQRLWLSEYAKHGNATKAALDVYKPKNPASAKDIGYLNAHSLDMTELMHEMGLSDAQLVKTLREGLQAKRHNRPDHYARFKFLELGFKVNGRLQNGESASNLPQMSIQVGIFQAKPGTKDEAKNAVMEAEEVEEKP